MTDQLPLGDWAPPLDPALSQYHTPVKLAKRMVRWAGVEPGMRVLEPSAGGGNIVRALLDEEKRPGNMLGFQVVAIEKDEKWAKYLVDHFACPVSCYVLCADFLNEKAECTVAHAMDLAVMNPPLNGGVAGEHIMHALKFAPRAISLIRGGDLHGVDRYERFWSQCDLARVAHLCRRPPFGGDWHVGNTEFCVVDVYRKGTYTGHQSIEHWADSWG
jgi:hypothetical protein